MALSPESLQQLRQYIATDKALAAEILEAKTPEAAAQVLTATSAQHGIGASGEDILAYVQEHVAAHTTDLTDAQLDAVAGGTIPREQWYIMSYGGLGIGCAVLSIIYAADPQLGGCK